MRLQALKRVVAAAGIALALAAPADAAASWWPSAAQASPTLTKFKAVAVTRRCDSAGVEHEFGRELAKDSGQVGRLSHRIAYGSRTRRVLTA